MRHRRRFPVLGMISALVVVTTGCDLPSLDDYDPCRWRRRRSCTPATDR
jgi:hypothetical protein